MIINVESDINGALPVIATSAIFYERADIIMKSEQRIEVFTLL